MSVKAQQSEPESFKVLRAVNPAVLGGTQPLQVAKVHFPNAQGGLRLVAADDVRALAQASAQNLLKALGKF